MKKKNTLQLIMKSLDTCFKDWASAAFTSTESLFLTPCFGLLIL